jgi:hypothetical protein
MPKDIEFVLLETGAFWGPGRRSLAITSSGAAAD